MNNDDKLEIVGAIGELKATVAELGKRMDRTEKSRAGHLDTIYGELKELKAAYHVDAGKRTVIGWLVVVVGASVSAAIGALVGRWMP